MPTNHRPGPANTNWGDKVGYANSGQVEPVIQIWGKHRLGVRAGKYKLGASAGKYKLGTRAGKHKFGARAGK